MISLISTTNEDKYNIENSIAVQVGKYKVYQREKDFIVVDSNGNQKQYYGIVIGNDGYILQVKKSFDEKQFKIVNIDNGKSLDLIGYKEMQVKKDQILLLANDLNIEVYDRQLNRIN